MPAALSARTKQAFQAVGVVSTVMVVAIHYRSAAPATIDPSDASANALVQEFLLGGLCRVAVPLFSLACGLFYFASCDGTLATHLIKLRQRISTVLAPYLIVGGIALSVWVANRNFEGRPVDASLGELMLSWWLGPPVEQLWFLRDLIVLALLAPLLGWLLERAAAALLAVVLALWLLNVQPFPILHGWYALNVETLLFFSIGGALAMHSARLEAMTHAPRRAAYALTALWLSMTGVRIWIRPDFDLWYVDDYDTTSLLLHQVSILAGVAASLAWAARSTSPAWPRLSGLSFFVYLVHGFPLRAAVERFVGMTSLEANSFWLAAPIVTVGCYLSGWWLCRYFPLPFAVLTGGRTPSRALRIRDSSGAASAQLGAST